MKTGFDVDSSTPVCGNNPTSVEFDTSSTNRVSPASSDTGCCCRSISTAVSVTLLLSPMKTASALPDSCRWTTTAGWQFTSTIVSPTWYAPVPNCSDRNFTGPLADAVGRSVKDCRSAPDDVNVNDGASARLRIAAPSIIFTDTVDPSGGAASTATHIVVTTPTYSTDGSSTVISRSGANCTRNGAGCAYVRWLPPLSTKLTSTFCCASACTWKRFGATVPLNTSDGNRTPASSPVTGTSVRAAPVVFFCSTIVTVRSSGACGNVRSTYRK